MDTKATAALALLAVVGVAACEGDTLDGVTRYECDVTQSSYQQLLPDPQPSWSDDGMIVVCVDPLIFWPSEPAAPVSTIYGP